MVRRLATIQMIDKIEPILNADNIVCASVLGWKVVVKKNDFKEGDLCVYCEIDSMLPIKPEYEFLRKSCYKKFENGIEGFRIKTIRLKGQVSQGVCFKLNLLDNIIDPNLIKIDLDVTEVLKINLYQPPIPSYLKGLIKGPFPSFMPKTDETRVQLLQSVINRYKGIKCYITEKIDGSSITVYLNNGIFGVCSRNLEMLDDNKVAYWQVVKELKIEEKLRNYCTNSNIKNICLQGELCGNGIQDNRLRIQGQKIFWFNIFDIDKYEYLNFKDFINILTTDLKLESVPILTIIHKLETDIDALIKLSIGKSIVCPDVWREGIVIRPLKEKLDMEMSQGFSNGRLSFKVINPEYLIEYEE